MRVRLFYGSVEKINKGGEHEAGRFLLDSLMSTTPIREYEIETDELGKPHIKGRDDVQFSITHSRGFVAVILSLNEGRVGIDAEPCEGAIPNDKQARFAERYFSERERRAINEGKRTFSDIWTRKEAYLKLDGMGIRTRLSEVDTENMPATWFHTYNFDGFTVTVAKHTISEIYADKFEG